MSPVRRSANERSAPRAACLDAVRPLGAAAAEQAVLGDDRELQAGGDEAVAQRGVGEAAGRRLRRVVVVLQPARLQPREVVGGALALAAARPRDDRAVAASARASRARGSASLQRAGGEVGGLGAELERLVGATAS